MTGFAPRSLFLARRLSRTDIPKFGEPIQNQTIAVGREAVFSCVVDNLQTYKVSFSEGVHDFISKRANKCM
jgi:hypothetical protein